MNHREPLKKSKKDRKLFSPDYGFHFSLDSSVSRMFDSGPRCRPFLTSTLAVKTIFASSCEGKQKKNIAIEKRNYINKTQQSGTFRTPGVIRPFAACLLEETSP